MTYASTCVSSDSPDQAGRGRGCYRLLHILFCRDLDDGRIARMDPWGGGTEQQFRPSWRRGENDSRLVRQQGTQFANNPTIHRSRLRARLASGAADVSTCGDSL